MMNIEHEILNMELNNQIRHKMKFDLEEQLVDFAVRLIEISESLHTTPTSGYDCDQPVRSETFPMLLYGEVPSAASMDDFDCKLKIVLKELREILAGLKNYQRRSVGNKMKKADRRLIQRNRLYEKFHNPLSFVETWDKANKCPLSFGEGPGVRPVNLKKIIIKTKNNPPAVKTLEFKL